MAAGRNRPVLLVVILVISLLVGVGILFVFAPGAGTQGASGVDAESYPVAPGKPSPLNASTVEGYAVTYEQRLFHNDLLASQDHNLAETERVVANCRGSSVSNSDAGRFRVELACRGGITTGTQLPESAAFTYSVTYRITESGTEQTGLRNYPFGADRTFNDQSS